MNFAGARATLNMEANMLDGQRTGIGVRAGVAQRPYPSFNTTIDRGLI
jgi:hypothetical protein